MMLSYLLMMEETSADTCWRNDLMFFLYSVRTVSCPLLRWISSMFSSTFGIIFKACILILFFKGKLRGGLRDGGGEEYAVVWEFIHSPNWQ